MRSTVASARSEVGFGGATAPIAVLAALALALGAAGFPSEARAQDPATADTDGDGALDVRDACPTEPGPLPSGCPVRTTPGGGQNGKRPRVWAYSNFLTPDTLRGLGSVGCPPKNQKFRGRVSVASTLAAADAVARRAGGSKGMRAFRKSKAYRDPLAARQAAADAMLTNRPGAALAALLRARQLHPRNPDNLRDLASVLVQLGKPREALVLLDAAGRIKKPKFEGPPPMGIDRTALTLNTRGLAQLEMGKLKDAKKTLARAVARDDLLAEARTNLAVAKQCQDLQVPVFNVGTRRDPDKRPVDGLDLSQGRKGVLPFVHYPESPGEAAVTSEANYNQSARWFDQGRIDAAGSDPTVAVGGRGKVLSERYLGLLIELSGYNVFGPPESSEVRERAEELGVPAELLAAGDALNEQRDAVTRYHAEANPPSGGECEDLAAYWAGRFPGIRAEVVELDRRMERWFELVWEFDTALAANASGSAHDWFIRNGLYKKDNALGELYGNAAAMGPYYFSCGDGPGQRGIDVGDVDNGSSGPCSALEPGSLSFDFGVFELEVGCENIGVEVSGAGWISAFASFDYNLRTGDMTVFAGAKAGTEIGPVEAEAKIGIYATVNRSGEVTDYGLRSTGSLGAQGGGVKGSVSAWSSDVSFAPRHPTPAVLG